jgi:hypothetical protein
MTLDEVQRAAQELTPHQKTALFVFLAESLRKENILLCSFCGKSHADVKKLIAGPGVYICDECVVHCKNALEKELGTDVQRPPTQ